MCVFEYNLAKALFTLLNVHVCNLIHFLLVLHLLFEQRRLERRGWMWQWQSQRVASGGHGHTPLATTHSTIFWYCLKMLTLCIMTLRRASFYLWWLNQCAPYRLPVVWLAHAMTVAVCLSVCQPGPDRRAYHPERGREEEWLERGERKPPSKIKYW